MFGIRKELDSARENIGIFQQDQRNLFLLCRKLFSGKQPESALLPDDASLTNIHVKTGYPYNNPRLSCQVDYLQRSDYWERGCLSIPYYTRTDSSGTDFLLPNRVYFDLETFYLPWDLGYSRRYAVNNRSEVMPKQRLGLAVTINSTGQVDCWDECQAIQLVDYLLLYNQVISYNGLRFDNLVLSAYSTPEQILKLTDKTFDLYQYLQDERGSKKSLSQWTERYLGSSNFAKSLINDGLGYEEKKLVQGFNPNNSIPFILREGAAAQRRLVWVACFEDVVNTRAVYTELQLEQKFRDAMSI